MIKNEESIKIQDLQYKTICDTEIAPILKPYCIVEDLIWSINNENLEQVVTSLRDNLNNNIISINFINHTFKTMLKSRVSNNFNRDLFFSAYYHICALQNAENVKIKMNEILKPFITEKETIIYEDKVQDLKAIYQLVIRQNSYNLMPYIDLAAACGSINIFKFLILNHCKFTRKTAKNAIQGGNMEIIKILQNNNISFDHCLRKSIKYHRNTISDWLLSNYSCEKVDLVYCILKGNTQAANFFIQNEILISENEKYSIDLTSLGVIHGNIDLVKYFYSLQHETISSDIEIIDDPVEVEKMELELKKMAEKRKNQEKEEKIKKIISYFKKREEQYKRELKPIYVGSSTSEEEEEMKIIHPPITYSVVNNYYEITKFLVEKGGDVSYKPKFASDCQFVGYIRGRNSLLSIAMKNKNTEIAKLLIENGADINYEYEKDGVFWPMLAFSIKKHMFEISKLLIDKGAQIDSYVSTIKELKIKMEKSWTPLILAVKEDSLELVKILVEKGAQIDFCAEEHFGVNTAMTTAVYFRRFDILDYLISQGGNVNEFHIITPLFVAVKNNDVEMIQFLAVRNVDVNKDIYIEKKHLTALAYAAYLGKTDAARALIEIGADKKLRNPLRYAQRQGHMDIVNLFSNK